MWISKMSPMSSTLTSPQLWNRTFIEWEGKLFSPVVGVGCLWRLRGCFEESRSVLFHRTARADNPGTALSFISHKEVDLLSEVEEALTGGKVESWPAIQACLSTLWCLFFLDHSGSVLKPYEFKMEEIEGFRYRCRVSVLHQDQCALRQASVCVVFSLGDVWKLKVCPCVGRHALGDQAGSERGQTEGDQAGAAKFRET